MITGIVPKPGRIGLGYFADEKGRIVTEMSIMAIEEDRFVLITAAVAQLHDFEWLQKHLPQGSELTLEDATESLTCQILAGPKSRDILAEVCDADLSLPWLSHQSTEIAGRWCQLVRVSFAGELGWEIHSKVDDTPTIFDAVWAAGQKHGLKPFGMFALDSLRLEKGYRAWKQDLSTDYTVLQGGLERFVKWDKPDFKGKAALQNEKQQGVKKRFVTLVVDAGEFDAPYMSTLWHDGKIVGETTSGGFGHRVDKSIALGMLRADLAEPGTEIEVEIFGERFAATVQKDEPLWDPEKRKTESITCQHHRTRISGIVPSGKDGWEVHFAAWKRKEAGEPIIMLSVGDHDFDTPSETVEACVAAVSAGHHHYTQLPGIPRLREAMARASTRCTGVETSAAEVHRHAGRAARALCRRAGHARSAATTPSWWRPITRPIPARSAPPAPTSPSSRREAEDGFQPRAEAIEAALKPNTRAILINTPNNPTGAVYSRESLEGHRRALPASTTSGCSPTRSTGRSAAAITSRRARCPAWRSARWSSTRCRRATA